MKKFGYVLLIVTVLVLLGTSAYAPPTAYFSENFASNPTSNPAWIVTNSSHYLRWTPNMINASSNSGMSTVNKYFQGIAQFNISVPSRIGAPAFWGMADPSTIGLARTLDGVVFEAHDGSVTTRVDQSAEIAVGAEGNSFHVYEIRWWYLPSGSEEFLFLVDGTVFRNVTTSLSSSIGYPQKAYPIIFYNNNTVPAYISWVMEDPQGSFTGGTTTSTTTISTTTSTNKTTTRVMTTLVNTTTTTSTYSSLTTTSSTWTSLNGISTAYSTTTTGSGTLTTSVYSTSLISTTQTVTSTSTSLATSSATTTSISVTTQGTTEISTVHSNSVIFDSTVHSIAVVTETTMLGGVWAAPTWILYILPVIVGALIACPILYWRGRRWAGRYHAPSRKEGAEEKRREKAEEKKNSDTLQETHGSRSTALIKMYDKFTKKRPEETKSEEKKT